MSEEITWTAAELAEFDRLIDQVSSWHQALRSSGRFAMNDFVKRHTKEKCDAMWAHLEGKEAAK